MTGIRWGKFSGKNRGGAGGQGKKCDKSEGKDAVKSKEGEDVKNRGLLHSPCTETSIIDGALIEIKSHPHVLCKSLQDEGMIKKLHSSKREHNILHKEEVIKNTDLCGNGFDTAFNKIKTRSNLNNQRVGILRKFESCEKGINVDCKEKLADERITCKGIQGVKQVMFENQCIERLVKKCASDIECRKDAKRNMQDNEYQKRSILDMEQGISNCTHMLHVGLHANSVKREKKAHSCDEGGDAKCTDNTNSVAFDKPGDADYMMVVVRDKAGDANCMTSTQSNGSIGVDSKSMKVEQRKVCNAEVEEKKDDVYEETLCADSEVPHDFICPISKKVMEEPVVIASGQTFERASIQAWLDEGNALCPVTHKPLSHLQLIPNLTLKALISSWYPPSHDSSVESTQHSFSSCTNSLSSCPTLMAAHHQSLVSCSSFSVSNVLEEAELYSSSGSSSSLPKLLMDAELHSFSSSSVSVASYATPEHLRAASIYNFPSPLSTSSPSPSWDQEIEVFDVQENTLQPSKLMRKRRGHEETVMSETSQRGNSHAKSTDSMLLSSKPCDNIVSRINSLVSGLDSEYLDIQRSAAAELRLLAKHDDSNRLMIASAGAIRPLVALLWSTDDSIQLEATTTLLNLSLNHSLKDSIVKEGAIDALVNVLRDGFNKAVKGNAAVTLACLATSEENKSKIGSASAVEPLVNLLDRGSQRGKKDAAAALYRLSSIDENKKRIVRAGASRLLVDFMSEGDKDGMVDKAIAIVGNLVSIEEGRVAFVEEGGVLSLMQVLRTGSKGSAGLAVSILLQLCTHSSKHLLLVSQKDPLPALMELSKTASTRLKAQISELIEVLIVDAN